MKTAISTKEKSTIGVKFKRITIATIGKTDTTDSFSFLDNTEIKKDTVLPGSFNIILSYFN